MNDTPIDDLLDRLVADYLDARSRGEAPDAAAFVERAPPAHREALARCLRLVDGGHAGSGAAPRPLGPGSETGGFRIDRVLGSGGMATVYLAEELALRRPVALKVLRPALAIDATHRERFLREGRAIARLDHPNVIRVHSVGEADGHLLLAMEHVPGPTLARVLADLPERRPWSPADLEAAGVAGAAAAGGVERTVARLLAGVARGVAAAHAAGVVHRDLKPSNVLLRADGTPVVADFGLALSGPDAALTLTGDTLGTPFYMSPEQVDRARTAVDERTDVYSLGVTLYEALSGERPFKGDSVVQVFDAIRNLTPPPLRAVAPECTPDAQAVTSRAMARRPEDRYASAAELAEDLEALAAGSPTRARAAAGGPLRRLARALQAARTTGLEYRSPRTLLGLPLVHVNLGPRLPGAGVRRARGWLAVGHVASGFVALGSAVSFGALAFGGGLGVGLLGIGGGLGCGLLGLGGVAAGGLAIGGAAGGVVAVGGAAAGLYALGGAAFGPHVVSGAARDPEAVEFFREHLSLFASWIP